mmetsp:Transcript_2127/g.4569  ORF Transcript_2127/g.4569 Transcript_2127/m.4569 type:complete len:228 (+) Transcript_2127:156-839(+)|eukprot:CAMPEP_0172595778 /NCGR_PEP_ID=MMETSP1068-20121228/15421_1 /TAXON_ID=35684 /ORGANISM="Pseudopedinella elastica, Strain CCMP716" /LENGTH=227 /DNA_ID=CAMNT_0013394465 /DNA_START=83 /DNA_END=766 /DNA_ORIENTATION=+
MAPRKFWPTLWVLSALTIPLTHSTTLVAAHYKGGIIMGADSRTSRGGYIANRFATKLRCVTPGICLARSGSAADTQSLAEYLVLELADLALEVALDRGEEEGDEWPRVLSAAHILRRRCYAEKSSLSASLICAGWDGHLGLQIYSVPIGGSLVRMEKYALSGSGGSYIYGWCDRTWRPDFTREECIRFVTSAVELAMERDCSSGGGVNLVCIEPRKPMYQIEPCAKA